MTEESVDETATEEPFMKYVRKEKWKRKAGLEKKKQRIRPLAYEKSAKLEKRLDEILPEPEVPFEDEPIEDVKISYKKGDKLNVLETPQMRVTQYEIRRNPNIIFLFRVNSAKMYYHIENDCYWLYVFSGDRGRIRRKIRIQKHDIQWLLAFALYDRYGEELPKQLWINRDMKKKVEKIVERERQHYETMPFDQPKKKPSNYSGETVENTMVLGRL